MINHIISKWSKLAQKEYKTRHDWVGKVIHEELCKKLKFDHKNKWYMHNLESVLENETHKLLWNFEIHMDLIIIIMSRHQHETFDSLPPSFSIVHRFQQVFKATSCIRAELFYVHSSLSSWLRSSIWSGPQEYITYEFIPTSPAVSRMSGLSNLDSFHDGW